MRWPVAGRCLTRGRSGGRWAVRPGQHAFPPVLAAVATGNGKIGGAFPEDLIDLLEGPTADYSQSTLQFVPELGEKNA